MVKKPTSAAALSPEASRSFQAQFRHLPTIPEQVHRVAYQLGTRAGDLDLLELVVSRQDAPADLLEIYRSLGESRLRVAFLSRPGHSTEFLRSEIASEKRAGVLKALITPKTPQEVLDLVSAVFVEKPTRTLAEVLLQVSERLSLDAQLKLFEVLVPRYSSLTQTVVHQLKGVGRSLAAQGPVVAARAAELMTLLVLAEPFLELPGLSAKARLTLIETALKAELENPGHSQGPAYQSYYARRVTDHILAAATRLINTGDLQPEVVAALESLADHERFPAEKSKLLRSRLHGPVAAKVSKSEREVLLEQAGRGDETAQVRILFSDDFTLEERRSALSNLYRVKAILPRVAALPRELVELLYLKSPEELVETFGFSLFEDPEQAQLDLVAAAVKEASSTASRYRSYGYGSPVLSLLSTGKLSTAAVDSVPWSYVQNSSSPHLYRMDAGSLVLLARVTALQSEHLGESLERWETFVTLSSSFTGTVGELFDTVVTLTPEA